MILDYNITPPVESILKHYHPYPEHLQNYKRIYGKTSEKAESSRFEGKPLDIFLSFLDGLGISRFVVKARDIETTFGLKIPNESVAELVRSYPDRIIGISGADPHKGREAVRELDHAVRNLGLKGLNLQLYELKLIASDRKLYPLYEKCCELDVPINIHVSVNFANRIPLKYGHPIHLDQVAIDFPDLKLIASPPGWPWVHELIAVAWRHPNVYIGLNSMRPKLLMKPGSGYEPLFTYGNGVLQDKVIFGSGWPLLPLEQTLDEIRSLPWRPQVLTKLLWDNAAHVFGIA
jgi:hypothetical protein